MTTPTTISLGLGSGGARGYAHIGVIRWIEENGHELRAIAGSSMGALVGGIHAAGQLGEFAEWATAIRKSDIVSLLDVVLGRAGLVKGNRMMDALHEFVGDRTIEELAIPFIAVASDVVAEKEVWIASGSLYHAIRASISIPLFFVPHEVDGRELLDGGILNPVPVAPTLDHHADLLVAVNLTGQADPGWVASHAVEPREPDDRSKVRRMVDRFLDGAQERVRVKNNGEPSMVGVATEVVDAMQSALARMKLAAYPPDVEVAIPRDACQVLEFDRAHEMIEIGYRAAEEQLGTFIAARRGG